MRHLKQLQRDLRAGRPLIRRALFLDRDGVINHDRGYVHRIADFEFMDGIFDLCKIASGLGFQLIVVTNQAGIGRGYFTETAFRGIIDWMSDRFREHGLHLTAVYHCPYHPEYGVGEYRRDSEMRKPGPGMILQAQRDFGLSLRDSVLIGDQTTDIAAGKTAGVGTNILFSGATTRPEPHAADLVVANLREAADWLQRTFATTGRA